MRVLAGDAEERPRSWEYVLTEEYDPQPGWEDIGASKTGLLLYDGFAEISFAEYQRKNYWRVRTLGEEEITLVCIWMTKWGSLDGMVFHGVHRVRLVNNPHHLWWGECATVPMRFHFQERHVFEQLAPAKIYA